MPWKNSAAMLEAGLLRALIVVRPGARLDPVGCGGNLSKGKIMRKFLLCVGLTFTLAFAGPAAMAGSPDVDINIGVPGVGIYGGDNYDEDYDYRRRRISCGEARSLVRDRGYNRVRRLSCGGRIHTFEAFRRGRLWLVTVHARTGNISRRPY
jgi:hypothetical protein